MALRPLLDSLLLLLLVVVYPPTIDALLSQTLDSPFSRSLAELKESVARALGSQVEGVELTGFDVRDAVAGRSVVYEFHVEIDGKVLPMKLLEDVNRWESVDLERFRGGRAGLVEAGRIGEEKAYPVLDSFQLAGPMELWIQDGDDMRLALPHDVDAGVLKKVILSDGAVVTVKGARSISLRHPVELPLPLNRTNPKGKRVAAGLLSIAEALRSASMSNERPLLSLRIVGPTSLTTSSSPSSNDRLKLKRLAPGYVQLSSPSVPAISGEDDHASPSKFWPLMSLDGSDASLLGFEELLASVLGTSGKKDGSFRLLKAEVSAQTYVKLSFAMTKPLSDKNVNWSGFPEWKTRPEKVTSHYEVLARLEDNGRVIPERIAEVHPFEIIETVTDSALTGNVSMSKAPTFHPPPVYFTL